MDSKTKIKWLDKPVEPDFTAAGSYLSLIHDLQTATTICKRVHGSLQVTIFGNQSELS